MKEDRKETVLDMIQRGATRFDEAGLYFGHGTDNALDEAAWLSAHALGLPFEALESEADRELSEQETQAIAALYQQRIETRTPAAYLVNEAWFCGLSFYVDERVLIPRSPIAELIENSFTPWVDPENVNHILDLCAGSGCIGIACAYAFFNARVDLAELTDGALAVSSVNIERHGMQDRVQAVKSDVYSGIAGRKYDLIVSNPPYVSDAEMAELPAEYLNEPGIALAAGVDGLVIVKQILEHAADYLNPRGVLVVEVGNSEQAVVETFSNVPFVWLEFEYGGQGVFLLTAEDCSRYL